VDQTLCFAWQDNNTVIGITTAYRFKNETILKLRKCPAPTSTNALIVRPVLSGEEVQKESYIPVAINDYNEHMNGVDLANQLRAHITCHRPFKRRNWRPTWFWLVDPCRVNSWLLSEGGSLDPKKKYGQQPFFDMIMKALLEWPYPPKTP
jgi:hypothetical protein